jgi:replication factor A1
MKIKELKSGQGKVDIEATVKTKGDVRVMEKYGKQLKLANATVSDDSGEISLTLWNDDADKVKQGDKIKITNGYVSEFNGKLQLTSGKFGKLEVVS